ncbi:MAG: TonB family protein [Bacteroidales bacterium]|jgi:TonB family protein|nr:TonB family protein [Bacteroidales bacterium]
MATPVKYRNGLLGTILFHGLALFLLLYMAFRTPLPLPEEQGILVDFGNSNRGFGNFEPRVSDPAPVQPKPEPARTTQSEEQSLTQDIEETAALPPEKPKEKPKETPKETSKETPKETQPVEQPKPVERTVDTRAMYPGRGNATSTAASQGEAGGQGNQGVTTGAPDVHVYGEGGDAGGGNKFMLTGRNLVGRLPLPAYSVQDQGVVVVSITVDKDGNVTKATPGAKGSTTLNKTLLDAAEKAARQAKFSRKPDAIEQTGTITYIFKLQGE